MRTSNRPNGARGRARQQSSTLSQMHQGKTEDKVKHEVQDDTAVEDEAENETQSRNEIDIDGKDNAQSQVHDDNMFVDNYKHKSDDISRPISRLSISDGSSEPSRTAKDRESNTLSVEDASSGVDERSVKSMPFTMATPASFRSQRLSDVLTPIRPDWGLKPDPSPRKMSEQQQLLRPRRRFILKHMILENFKSYAGAQMIGPFHHV